VRSIGLDIAVVFTGGGLGAVSRWILSDYVQKVSRTTLFPWGTLAVNIIGSFLLGFIMGAAIIHGAFDHSERLFIATGFAGAFTTFSTFMYETTRLIADNPYTGIANLLASILLGLATVYLGYIAAGVLYG